MLDQIDAVLFDLDGTMVDSMGVWVEIDEEYVRNYHLTVPENFHENMEGKSYTETAEYFLEVFPELPKTVEDLKREWYEMSFYKYTHEIPLKEGLREFLIELKKRDIHTGIATSNDRKLVEAALEALEIDNYIDIICTGCEVKKGKPAPDVYLNAAAKLKADPSRCLVFEDVPMGILAGKNAGMKVCAVDDWFSRPQDTKKRNLADYYIRDYFEILNHTFEVL
ncbi:HAD family phosphatase [Roseburia hominis]